MKIEDSLRSIAKWGTFLGYVFIITGVLSALSGLFIFLVGAIPGLVNIFLGLFLLRSGKHASHLCKNYHEAELSGLLENYAKYLKVHGILFVVTLSLLTLMVVLSFVAFFFMGAISAPIPS